MEFEFRAVIHCPLTNVFALFRDVDQYNEHEGSPVPVLDKITEIHGDVQKDPATALRALSALGELHLERGDQEKGQDYFREALAISPEDETAAYNVGEIFFSNQKIEEAIAYFEMAAKIKKDWPKPYYKLGFVYLNKGDFDKSLENFKKFVELDPENPEIPNVRNIMVTIEKMKK